MSRQLSLIDFVEAKTKEIPVVDPNVDVRDIPRLGKSSLNVLARLKRGPATNVELMEVGGMRFGARIHDLKKHGYSVRSERLDGGIWVYELENGECQQQKE